MTITQRDRDLGTGYAMKPSTTRTELTSVGRGTPMGELLRRYWHPVGLVSDASDIPKKVRVLGEDLVLFRDRHGRAGLLHARCCHRGTTLYYGKVEKDGIRCCYHGWKFDAEGHCLEQPCEPEGGLFKDKVRQPLYPLQERYGLIFAYLGPAGKKPVLPRYECLEKMDDGEFVEADDSSIGGGGPDIIPCNWLQHFENVVDPYHVPVLHGSFSGPQFTNMMASMPEVKFETSARGVTVRSIRRQDDGKVFAAAKPSIRRYYVLALLTVIYALNFLDRTIFNVLIEPIKKSLRSATPRWACSQASASCYSIRCSASRSRASPTAGAHRRIRRHPRLAVDHRRSLQQE